LAVGPGMVWFGQLLFDPVGLADHVEAHWPRMDCIAVPGLLGKLNTPRPRQIGLNQWRLSGACLGPMARLVRMVWIW
jgi:hypothetical protein